jgi:hypothetical protein
LSALLTGAYAQEVISSGRMSNFLDELSTIIIFPKGLYFEYFSASEMQESIFCPALSR